MSLPPGTDADRVYELFTEASRLQGLERRAFLDELPPELRAEVESLVEAASQTRPSGDPSVWLEKLQSLSRTIDEERLPERIAHYRLLSRLGAGTNGIVFLAEDEGASRRVALKVLRSGRLDARSVQRFLFEIEALSRLRHPNVVRVFDSGLWHFEGGHHPYCAMECVDGQPLDHWLRKAPTLERRLDVFLAIASAIHEAHQALVLHRDIKPSNVLIDSQDCPKVLDFGVAKDLSGDPEATLTLPGELVGSLETMSPEQASGDGTVDIRSDVYGLSALLYLLLTSRLPIALEGCSYSEAIGRVQEAEPERPRRLDPSIPRELELIVLQGLAKEKSRRYQDVGALRSDIQRFRRHEPIEAQAPTPVYRARKWVRRHPVRSAVLTTVLVAAAALGTQALLANRDRLQLQSARAAQAELIIASLDVDRSRAERTALLDQLIAASHTQPEVRVATARALVEGADLKLNFSSGVESRGLEDLDQACTLLRSAVEENPGHPEVTDWRRELAIALVKRGDRDQHGGELSRAASRYQEAHEVFLAILRGQPGELQAMDDLGWSYARLADLHGRAGRPDEAMRLTDRRLELAQREVALFPDEPRSLANLCHTHLVLADSAEGTRSWRREQGLLAHETACRMADLAPEERRTLRYVIQSSRCAFDEARNREDTDRMLEVSSQATEAARHLMERELELHDLDLIKDAFRAHGDSFARQQRWSEAERAYRQVITALDERISRSPVFPKGSVSHRGQALIACGNAVDAQGRREEAIQLIREGLDVLGSLIGSDRPDIADVWGYAFELRRAPHELAQPERARQLVEGLLARLPEHGTVRGRIRLALAEWRMEDGDVESARELLLQLDPAQLDPGHASERTKLLEECARRGGR